MGAKKLPGIGICVSVEEINVEIESMSLIASD